MTHENAICDDEITRAEVPESRRLAVLPKFLGMRLMVIGENLIYSWMGALSPDYNGAQWDFYELSNGGFYMAPAGIEKFNIEVRGNGYSGVMSADAAGITACLFAFGQLANQRADAGSIELYHKLREFALRHFEASEILAAID